MFSLWRASCEIWMGTLVFKLRQLLPNKLNNWTLTQNITLKKKNIVFIHIYCDLDFDRDTISATKQSKRSLQFSQTNDRPQLCPSIFPRWFSNKSCAWCQPTGSETPIQSKRRKRPGHVPYRKKNPNKLDFSLIVWVYFEWFRALHVFAKNMNKLFYCFLEDFASRQFGVEEWVFILPLDRVTAWR